MLADSFARDIFRFLRGENKLERELPVRTASSFPKNNNSFISKLTKRKKKNPKPKTNPPNQPQTQNPEREY